MTIRPLVIAAAAVVFLLLAKRAGRHRARWIMIVAPLAWLVHVILFFIAAQYQLLPPTYLNIWSSAVHIHAIITFATWCQVKRL